MRGLLRRDERGAIAIEFMLVISMLLVVFLLMLQYALKAHAHRIASAAAEEGLVAATGYSGTAAQGRQVAREYVERLGPGLAATEVRAERGSRTASVMVAGNAEQFLPFLTVHVAVTLEGPVERFVEETP